MILQNSKREFINFFFELLCAAKQGLSINKMFDSKKNLFYSSRYKWDTNTEGHDSINQYSAKNILESSKSILNQNENFLKLKSKQNLNTKISSLSKKDLVDIFVETANSFKNVNLPRSIFEQMIDRNINQFKNQLEGVIMNQSEEKSHKNEIEMIYYEIQKNQNNFEMDKITFYYFFKMNSLFSNWGVFDYETFKTRCKSMLN